ncbi:MAG: RNA methyltransferase [Planctomycetia bacterium]|nr:RNA methyltransferase [Planctomycetia bacterium]
MNQPQIIKIVSSTDPYLKPYCNLRERTLRGESIFIAEGRLVTERLIASEYQVESLLISAERFETEKNGILATLSDDVPIYVAENSVLLDRIVGYQFYQGILALGRRKKLPNFVEGVQQTTCNSSRPLSSQKSFDSAQKCWVVLPKATKPDNLGLVFRCAAALGAEAVILGEECCDPFSRRALRVSMGGVLQLPIFQSLHLKQEILQIKEKYPDISFYATVLDDQAKNLNDIDCWPCQAAFLFGNEFEGLSDDLVQLCHQKLTIPMNHSVDSLNLGVSVALFLYDFRYGKKGAQKR